MEGRRAARLAAAMAAAVVEISGLGGAGGAAHASGFLAAEFGGEQGHPTTDDLTAMYFNPAGLALASGTRVELNALFGVHHLTYDRPADAIDHVVAPSVMANSTPQEAISANSGHASLTNFVASPFVGGASDFGVKHLAVGLAVYAPFGGQASWDNNSVYTRNPKYPGAMDGVQRWAVIDGTIQSFYVTLAGAYYIPQARLALGLGVNIVASKINLTRARNADGTDNLVTGGGTLQEGRSWIDVTNATASLSFGLVWRPLDNLWVGASYQSQPGFGELTYSGTLNDKLGISAATAEQIELKQSLPDVVRAGVRWRPRWNWELRLHGEFVRWSVFNEQCILDATNPNRSCSFQPSGALKTATVGAGVILNVPRDWHDAFRVHLGASYWVLSNLEVFLGCSFDSNAVPDSTMDPSLPDMNKIIADGGARIEVLGGKLAIAGTYSQFIFLDRDVPVRPRDPSGTPIAPLPPSRNPDGGGLYTQGVGLFSLTGLYRF